MSSTKLDLLYIHNDDIAPAESGQFGSIYHRIDFSAARKREIDNLQRTVAANKLSEGAGQ